MIFRNLIDNAVKYAGTPAEIEVTLEMDTEEQVLARVCDNGPGIPPKLRRKIFGRFVRLGKELEREKPGMGLGLFIVRMLVARLRGRVRAHGVSEGTGTVFEVILPGRRVEPKNTVSPSSPQPAPQTDVA